MSAAVRVIITALRMTAEDLESAGDDLSERLSRMLERLADHAETLDVPPPPVADGEMQPNGIPAHDCLEDVCPVCFP